MPPVLGLLDDIGLPQLMLVRLSILFLKSAVSFPAVVVRCSALLKLSTCIGQGDQDTSTSNCWAPSTQRRQHATAASRNSTNLELLFMS